jgi:hypothetical protein
MLGGACRIALQRRGAPLLVAVREQLEMNYKSGSRAGLFAMLFGLLMALAGMNAYAQSIGMVEQVTGTLSAVRGGATRILSIKSEVQRGDTLATQRDSYATVRFTDGSIATLRPNTTLRIDDYQFDQKAPQSDNIGMSLLKGGLRTVTGLIGKRGNQDAYKIQTSTATIGIRGSSGDTMDCMTGCEGVTAKSGGLAPGVYHVTHTDLYIMVTKAGQVLVGAGQFGFASDINKPPVLLAGDPGLGLGPLPFALGSSNPVQECRM